ncbi:MAG: 50S ribosomal protein L11 methyltransferase [Bacteroidales bacterium]|jgi:ribosomal protein L11 methyltransferase|nr:50S ribosomal protein L11 methyltransferase [Bacteroidales bacterium]NLM93822.1 50S ribosomal protein L11 methyltransferase [Bacteroidales bacterium]
MSSLDYVELSCTLDPVQPWSDIFIAALADIGFESFEENEKGFKAYISAHDFREEDLADALDAGDADPKPRLEYAVKHIDGQNWNQVWESNFEPVLIGNACYVRAPFHPSKPGVEMEFVIEPKMSFGTGHHETTSLMAEWLLEEDVTGKAVLDMGCGTGLLAIMAARKGAEPVLAIDNYIYAYENTIENAERNNTPWIRVLHGDASLLGAESFDVILANITKNVLLQDMETYVSVLNEGGVLLLSGFLEKDRKDMIAAVEGLGLSYSGEKKKKDWLALRFQK